MRYVSSRAIALSVCSALVAALLAVAVFAPLPVTIATPGETANVLGDWNGQKVISITGAPTRTPDGRLRMVTIEATVPSASVHLTDVAEAWFRTDEAAMPHDAVYPADTVKEAERQNAAEMRQSQDAATAAALKYLHLSSERVKVRLTLAGVGGPSAGMMFTLGIIDLVRGDGHGGDLTGGRDIAGTGTITPGGAVGAVGGVQLKERAARKDGATVFLVPRDECADATAVTPAGLRVVPVTTLDSALAALAALRSGARLPAC
jgi:PDZ domain-containing protein